MSERIPPNRDLIGLARTLETLAWRDTAVRDHLAEELALLDGQPARSGGGGRRGVGSVADPAGNIALARQHVSNMLANLADDRDAIGQLIRSYAHDLDQAARLRAGTDTAAELDGVRYCDGTHLAGAEHLWQRYGRTPENGWFDPSCRDIADGDDVLCDRCRIRERRWRDRNGLPLRANNTPEPTRQEQLP
jgi:hypothetical protein